MNFIFVDLILGCEARLAAARIQYPRTEGILPPDGPVFLWRWNDVWSESMFHPPPWILWRDQKMQKGMLLACIDFNWILGSEEWGGVEYWHPVY